MERTLPLPHERALHRASRLQRAVHALRTEADSRGRESAAIGTGLFIGCSPFWGFQLAICWGAGWLLGLNRLKVYLAANLVNPLILPALLYTEVQAGALVRQGEMVPLTLETLRTTSPWDFGADLLVGSLIVGAIVGVVGGVLTFLARRPTRDPFFHALARRAADRYLDAGISAWEFARGKTTGDPAFRYAIREELAGGTGTLVDLGCGQGLLLALLAEARATADRGEWQEGRVQPPAFDRLIGIETRPRMVRFALRALDTEAEVRAGDIRDHGVPPCDVVVIFDVLHMLPSEDQREMLMAVHAALPPGGRLLLRDADAGGGWGFRTVQVANRLKSIIAPGWRHPFHYRTADGWRALLDETGFDVVVKPMGQGTPFANVLIVATRR
jgi:uncharacterized protein (DUF2062 family)/SAM-dependent methyltransferase